MKLKFLFTRPFLLFWLQLFAIKSAFAASPDYSALMENILQNQSHKLLIDSLSNIQSTHLAQSQSWLGGDINFQISHENGQLIDNNRQKNWQLGMEFPLSLPQQKQALKQLSGAYQQLGYNQNSYLRWLASSQLRNLVWKYRIAQIETSAAQNAMLKSRELQLKVSKKVKAGENPEIDLLLADKEIFKYQKAFVEKQNQLTVISNEFQLWTSQKNLPLNVNETLLVSPELEQHPELLFLATELNLNQTELNSIRAFKKQAPSLYLGAKNEKDRDNNDTSLVFQLSVPLGFNPAYSVQIAEQTHAVNRKTALLEQKRIALKQDIFKAKQELNSAELGIRFSQKQHDIAQKALTMSEQAYQLGENGIQNLLLVQQESLTAKLELQLAKARHGRAIANFNQVSGNILGE